ncbi:major facilitator superfamily domain-containing protein [Usnea florida]
MAKSKPLGLNWRSSTLFIVSTVGIGLFTDLFLYGLVVPILPFILQDRINLPHNQIQVHVSALLAAYAGASVLFSPPAGIIADRLPTRQLPFLIGLVALLLATLLLFLGQNVAVLTVARILQGISAAVVWTIGLALVLDTVGPENLGKTIGSIFAFISIGELAAPVLGGVIYKSAGYAGVFGLGFAIITLDFIMRILIIEKKTAAKYGVEESESGDGHASQPEQDAEDGHEETEEDPLIQKEESQEYKIPPDQPKAIRSFPILYCLKDPRLLTALLLAFVQATLLATFDATIPTEAQDLFNFDSLKAGLLFIALVLPYLVFGPIAGWAVDRYGPKPAAVIGFGYLVPVLILLRLVRAGGKSEIIVYCALLALCGIGMGVIGSPSIVEASYVVSMYDKTNPDLFGANGPYAQLYGINSMVFSLGLTVGPLISGSLKDAVGYGNMNIVVAALCLVTAVLSFIYIGGKPAMLKKRRG